MKLMVTANTRFFDMNKSPHNGKEQPSLQSFANKCCYFTFFVQWCFMSVLSVYDIIDNRYALTWLLSRPVWQVLVRVIHISNIVFLQRFLDEGELFAQTAFTTNETLMPPYTTYGEGFYIELFPDTCLPLEIRVQNVKGIKA